MVSPDLREERQRRGGKSEVRFRDGVVWRAELADRVVLLQLGPIPEERRRSESEIWAEFERE